MKLRRMWCAGALGFALAGCGTTPPEVYSQQFPPGVTPEPAGTVLVVIQGKVFSNTEDFGSEGSAYLKALANGFQQALPEIGTKVILKNGALGGDDQAIAEHALKPSHEIQIGTIRVTRSGATVTSMRPVSAAWQMDVESFDAVDGEHFERKLLYRAQTSGDPCVEGDILAARCGADMGKLMADSLRAAHVMQFGGGN